MNWDFAIPSRISCSDNCSPKAPSVIGLEETSVKIDSSFPSIRAAKIIISLVKLISDRLFDDLVPPTPMQTSRSLSMPLVLFGKSNRVSWILLHRVSNSVELISVGFIWNEKATSLEKILKNQIYNKQWNTSSSRWFPKRVLRCCGLPMHLSWPPTYKILRKEKQMHQVPVLVFLNYHCFCVKVCVVKYHNSNPCAESLSFIHAVCC